MVKKTAKKKVVKKKAPRTKAFTRVAAKKGPAAKAPAHAHSKQDPESKLLARAVAKIASDHKAIDIKVLELRKVTSFTDYFIICSGSSDRQVRAIANAIYDELKEEGKTPIGYEGLDNGLWALVDYGDVVAHVFYESEREYYQLEKLWSDAPIVEFKGITS